MRLFVRESLPPGDPIRGRGRVHSAVRTATDGRDLLVNAPDGWEVDQPWLWWLGPAGSNGTGGPFGNPPPGADGTGLYTWLPAVTRCTEIIVDTIAGLPWEVIRGDYERLAQPAWLADPQAMRPDARIADVHELEAIRLSAVEFWANWITAALWFGDGYVYAPVRDADGAPKPPLWQLHPDDVQIEAGTYWVRDVPLPTGSIIHLRGKPPYEGGHGRGVVTTHAAALGLSATVSGYASGIFSSGVPAGYLKSTSPSMTQKDADDLKAKWLAQHGGSKRSIAILNATTDFHAVSISPIDAQLSQAREWSLRDVALAFGVPAYMLGVPGDSATYANVESRMIELRTFTLLPWERRIESTLDAQLPRGTTLKVRSDALLRADTASRYRAYKDGLDAGWLTVDDVRRLEDLPPMATAEGVS